MIGRPPIDRRGMRYGRLVVIEIAETIRTSRTTRFRWLCQCECGNQKVVEGSNLQQGHVLSCGCYRKEIKTTHGLTGTPEHIVWQGMLSRCRNPNNNAFQYYGDRGITVCERWLEFSAFLDDMGPRPTERHTIERKDTNGNYCPENCIWLPGPLQNKNQGRRIDNTSGVTGVVWNAKSDRWEAFLGLDRKRVYLGLFDTVEEAARVRANAAKEAGFSAGHGRPR